MSEKSKISIKRKDSEKSKIDEDSIITIESIIKEDVLQEKKEEMQEKN